jgi:flavin-dependent dehydrogenase
LAIYLMSDASMPSTLTLQTVTHQSWEVAVVGAGPAGAMAAREAARAGARVLLVDRASFPRHKVCGCCLNGAALGLLADVGLADLSNRCQAHELRKFHLASGGRFACVPLTEGVALSRERLDAELIQAAISAGVEFLSETHALVGEPHAEYRNVELKRQSERCILSAEVIVIASGLGGRAFAEPRSESRRASRKSRVGAGIVLDDGPRGFAPGTIYMACHRDGYVGVVRLEDDRLDLAAALDGAAIKRDGGIAPLVEMILNSAGLPVPKMAAEANWHGTGKLTQHRDCVAGQRYFVIGDAAGYVEPFTGEGMAWALASGTAVIPFVLATLQGNDRLAQSGWKKRRNDLLGQRARRCWIVSTLLRYPPLVRVAIGALAMAPTLARPVVRSLNASFATDSSLRNDRS